MGKRWRRTQTTAKESGSKVNRHVVFRLSFALLIAVSLVFAGAAGSLVPAQAAPLKEVRLDYATYSPTSLVLKEKGWLEEHFGPKGIAVKWVFSLGSAPSNELLRSRAVDFASTAGAAALNARAQGVPLKSVYIFAKPEWTALVTRPETGITSVADLKGKRVAAYAGTDPWFFLIRALEAHGLTTRDVTIVNIPHPEGRIALERGDVDAWAGLDPHMADVELLRGFVLFYRNPDFNTYGTLNVLEDTLKNHPDVVKDVIRLYERARRWVIENPEETARILAEYARIDLAVAEKELYERMDFSNPVPGTHVYETLAATAPLLEAIPNNLPRWADAEKALEGLLVSELIEAVLAEEGQAQGSSEL